MKGFSGVVRATSCAIILTLNVGVWADNLEDRRWTATTDGHVTIYTPDDNDSALRLLRGLYLLRQAALLVPGIKKENPDLPIEIVVVTKKADMRDLGLSRYVILSPRTGFRKIAMLMRDWPQFSEFGSLANQYAHYLIHSDNTNNYPTWFHLGLAEYMSGTRWNSDEFKFGYFPAIHRGRFVWGGWLSARQLLLSSSYKSLSNRQRNKFNAQSWVLVHHLITNATEEKPVAEMLQSYLRMVDDGANEIDAFERAFGINPERLITILRGYVNVCCITMNMSAATALSRFSPSTRDLTRSEISVVLGKTSLARGNTVYARRWLEIAIDDETSRPEALSALGTLESYEENFDAAQQFFEAAVQSAPGDVNRHIDLGRFWVQRASTETAAEEKLVMLQRARKSLTNAWKIDRANAEIFFANGQAILIEGSELTKAVDMFEEAVFIQPANLQALTALAETYELLGNSVDAARVQEMISMINHGFPAESSN